MKRTSSGIPDYSQLPLPKIQRLEQTVSSDLPLQTFNQINTPFDFGDICEKIARYLSCSDSLHSDAITKYNFENKFFQGTKANDHQFKFHHISFSDCCSIEENYIVYKATKLFIKKFSTLSRMKLNGVNQSNLGKFYDRFVVDIISRFPLLGAFAHYEILKLNEGFQTPILARCSFLDIRKIEEIGSKLETIYEGDEGGDLLLKALHQIKFIDINKDAAFYTKIYNFAYAAINKKAVFAPKLLYDRIVCSTNSECAAHKDPFMNIHTIDLMIKLAFLSNLNKCHMVSDYICSRHKCILIRMVERINNANGVLESFIRNPSALFYHSKTLPIAEKIDYLEAAIKEYKTSPKEIKSPQLKIAMRELIECYELQGDTPDQIEKTNQLCLELLEEYGDSVPIEYYHNLVTIRSQYGYLIKKPYVVLTNGLVIQRDFTQPQNFGKIFFPNGDHYTGELYGSKMFGQGKMQFANKKSCEGHWEENRLKTGEGYSSYCEGFFEGKIVDFARTGEGTFTDQDGIISTGTWVKNSLFSGKGFIKLSSTYGFEGLIKHASPSQGFGILYKVENNIKTPILKGAWDENCMVKGKGSIDFGSFIFEGKFKDIKIENNKLVNSNNNSLEASIEDLSEGTMIFPDKTTITGIWKDGGFVGPCHFTYSNGETYFGMYSKSIPQENRDNSSPCNKNFMNGFL